ncbi:hypothetical protein BDR06DRAFT_889181, partial [Suillus hirtellus]
PPPVHPSMAVDGGAMWSGDDSTYRLSELIKASTHVWQCEQEGAPAHVIMSQRQNQVQLLTGWLQFHIATYMDNDIRGFPRRYRSLAF